MSECCRMLLVCPGPGPGCRPAGSGGFWPWLNRAVPCSAASPDSGGAPATPGSPSTTPAPRCPATAGRPACPAACAGRSRSSEPSPAPSDRPTGMQHHTHLYIFAPSSVASFHRQQIPRAFKESPLSPFEIFLKSAYLLRYLQMFGGKI